MAERRRNLVVRADGRPVNVARSRGQLFVCATGCCCGRTDDGFAPVPTDLYHREWERRRLRNVVHLTVGGCLGPCALANVVLLLFDGQALWFHSVNSEPLVLALYDHIEAMLEGHGPVPMPPVLAQFQFTATTWQPRPDGQPVDDHRPRRVQLASAPAAEQSLAAAFASNESRAAAPIPNRLAPAAHAANAPLAAAGGADASSSARLHRLLAGLGGSTAVPRRNGELVFDAPWQGRVFGMAVALSEQGLFAWEEFRQALIREVAGAETRGGEFRYYDAWLAAFERVLADRGVVALDEVEEVAFQFEFGERDEAF
jgi:cobaltochelatase CobN